MKGALRHAISAMPLANLEAKAHCRFENVLIGITNGNRQQS
jgi:hypothetical protein